MRRSRKNKRKKISFTTKLMFFLLVSLIITSLTISRYQTALKRSSTTETAKWLFALQIDDTQIEDSFQINLADTITSTSTKIKAGLIAPNTFGEFSFDIDCTRCDTGVVYSIELSDINDNLPSGLKFYTDSLYTQASQIVLNVPYTDTIPLNQLSTVRTETIYWQWPAQDETTANTADTLFNGETITLEVKIEGSQLIN